MWRKMVSLGLAFMIVAGPFALYAEYQLADGTQWQEVSSYGLSAQEELRIKVMLLKSAYEAALFNGNPLWVLNVSRNDFLKAYNGAMARYVPLVDQIYQQPDHLKLPLAFALKLADLVAQGAQPQAQAQFLAIMMLRLKDQGFLK